MKIRDIKRELKARGYQLLPKRGKGSHSIFKNFQTYHTIALSGKKGNDAKPYQLKLIK